LSGCFRAYFVAGLSVPARNNPCTNSANAFRLGLVLVVVGAILWKTGGPAGWAVAGRLFARITCEKPTATTARSAQDAGDDRINVEFPLRTKISPGNCPSQPGRGLPQDRTDDHQHQAENEKQFAEFVHGLFLARDAQSRNEIGSKAAAQSPCA